MPEVSILTFHRRMIPHESIDALEQSLQIVLSGATIEQLQTINILGFWLQQFLVQKQNERKLAIETSSFFISPGTDKSCSKTTRF